jgi:hypothetical protein
MKILLIVVSYGVRCPVFSFAQVGGRFHPTTRSIGRQVAAYGQTGAVLTALVSAPHLTNCGS